MFSVSVSVSLSHPFFTHSHNHSISLALSHTLSLSLSRSLSHALLLSLSLSLTFSHTLLVTWKVPWSRQRNAISHLKLSILFLFILQHVSPSFYEGKNKKKAEKTLTNVSVR